MSRRPFRTAVFLSFLLGLAVCGPAFALERPLTLPDAYQLSLERSEDIAMKAEVIREAEAHFYTALSGVLPKVNFVMTHFVQDAPAEGESSGPDGGASGSALRRSTPQKKFVFSQPLFSGFKEFAALQGAGAEKRQRQYEKQRAEELLFMDVMEAFYLVMQVRKEMEILDATRRIIGDRIKELKERVRVGRSRHSEVQASLSDLRLVQAELEGLKRVENVSRQLLEFYIGKEIDGGLAEYGDPSSTFVDIDGSLARRDARSDVKAAEEGYILAAKNVTAAQSGFFPKVKLDGNYYTQRVGFQSGIDWDVLLTVDIPIFDGAYTLGAVKEAAARREGARLKFQQSKRIAELEIENAYEELVSARSQARALWEASESARRSYTLNAKEYRFNLVNNLEVLEALRQYQNVHQRFNQVYYQTKRNFWKLKVALGETILTGKPGEAAG